MIEVKIIPEEKIPQKVNHQKKCPACGGQDIVKSGKSYNLNAVQQRYSCKTCGISFSERGYFGFKGKYPLHIKHLAIKLYLKEMSLRDVAEEINKNFSLNVSQTAITGWLRNANISPRSQQHKTRGKTCKDIVKISVLVNFCSSECPEKLLLLFDEDSVVLGSKTK